MNKELIVALDFASKEEVMEFLEYFKEEKLFVKVGMELFYQEGPTIIKDIKAKGHAIFLDLKLHDIPHTVYKAMRGIAKLGVDLTNVHASGGSDMMKAALKGLEEGSVNGKRPALIAVTQLTSMTEERMKQELLINSSLDATVLAYAKNAKESGLDGVVCSAKEAPLLGEELGEGFLKVTPGIRLAENNNDDQARVVTPIQASKLGSTAIVVGRTITKANDPKTAYEEVLRQWRGVGVR
ncbi:MULTISPECIES: orotidine-5'-phosphate decarboxylase [Bacillus]|uniref:orotidine-5'-phosphate decarboxylase n=1 Tax=Bacillus TaxID=1386 RepID=UPI000BB94A46|nr:MULTISPECIES: orotidine-5'-phosphate decarboxylase [Bacillus]